MKKQISILLFFVVFFCFAGSAYSQSNQNIKEEKIKVAFHCPHGKTFVEKGLKNAVGVVDANADLETKIVTVKYVEGMTNRDELLKVIEKTGYSIEDSKTSEFFNKESKQPENN